MLLLLDHCRLWHGGKSTGKHPCTWQDLAAARQVQKVAINELETAQQAAATAQQAVDALQTVWLREFTADNSVKADEAKQEMEKAEKKVAKAKLEVEKAEKKVAKAKLEVEKAKEAVKASVHAGPEQAGASAYAVVAVAFGLRHSRMVVVGFRAFHRFCFLGCCFPLKISLWLSCLHCVGLQHFGERGAWLLQVQANLVALRVLPMLQNGVSVPGSR